MLAQTLLICALQIFVVFRLVDVSVPSAGPCGVISVVVVLEAWPWWEESGLRVEVSVS